MRLASVHVDSFRGIPSDLALDFRMVLNEEPRSMVLVGDNGSGKSSIVDALEFCLQARIHRRQVGREAAEKIVSLASERLPRVEVKFSDGSNMSRELLVRDGQVQLRSSTAHELFAISPFVLRRSDILRFWNTAESERQMMFMDYFGSVKTPYFPSPIDLQVQSLEQKRLEFKNERRQMAALLAERMGIDASSIPLGLQEFEIFLNERLHGGLSGKQARRQRLYRRPIPRQLAEMVDGIKVLSKEIKSIEQEKSRIMNPAKSRSPRFQEVSHFFANTGDRIAEAFRQTSTVRFVERVSIEVAQLTQVSMSVVLHLSNGSTTAPQDILSEANRDLLALLIFLAVAEESSRRGQAKVLVLDDVFQSVDSTVRVAVMDYILRTFNDWQLILTVHDRLWQEQLRVLFQNRGQRLIEREIVRWTFGEGPVIREARLDVDGRLLEAMKRGDAASICAEAGMLLDAVCDRLSWTIPVSVKRRYGDKYTIGDLWPSVHKALRRTRAADVAEEINMRLHLRNLVGAHYNEWAKSVSGEEAASFGDAVAKLYSIVHCANCHRWIEARSDTEWQCRCGATALIA